MLKSELIKALQDSIEGYGDGPMLFTYWRSVYGYDGETVDYEPETVDVCGACDAEAERPLLSYEAGPQPPVFVIRG